MLIVISNKLIFVLTIEISQGTFLLLQSSNQHEYLPFVQSHHQNNKVRNSFSSEVSVHMHILELKEFLDKLKKFLTDLKIPQYVSMYSRHKLIITFSM